MHKEKLEPSTLFLCGCWVSFLFFSIFLKFPCMHFFGHTIACLLFHTCAWVPPWVYVCVCVNIHLCVWNWELWQNKKKNAKKHNLILFVIFFSIFDFLVFISIFVSQCEQTCVRRVCVSECSCMRPEVAAEIGNMWALHGI